MSADRVKTWLEDRSQLPNLVRDLEGEHGGRQGECRDYLRMYWNRPVVSSGNYTRPYRELALFDALKDRHGGNLTREVIDAAAAIICRQLSPEVSPMGADFDLEQGCKQASRLIDGVYDNSDFLQVAKRAMKDAMVCDVGPILGYVDEGTKEIRFERINPLEIYWVDNETDHPRTIVRVMPITRDELAARHPKHAGRIRHDKIAPWTPKRISGVDPPGARRKSDSGTVKLIEAWCVALGEKSPGRHTVMVGDIVLDDEVWSHEISPIITARWMSDFRGYAGCGLARIVSDYDHANRRLLRMVYAGLAGAVPQLLEHEDSETEGPSDQEFGRWKWDGPHEPKLVMPQTVSPEVIGQIEKNYARAYAEGGINQNMASGSAPARYTSGAAQREFVDIANTRLLDAQQQWERLWRDGAKVVVMLAQQAKGAHVKVKGANYYELVKFPNLPRDKFKVSFGLTSGLSLTPAGRLEELQELQKMGLADLGDVARNLNMPDTRQLADELNAGRDLIMKQIALCLDQDPKKPSPFDKCMPSAMMDLNAALKKGQERYQLAVLRGNYPKANVEKLRRWIRAVEARLKPPPTMADPLAANETMAPPPMPVDPNAPPPVAPPLDPAAAPPPAMAVA